MVIVSPIPGQEERNSDQLLEKGIAIKSNEFTTLAYKLDALLEDPARLRSMRAKALEYGRPHAAETIVDTLLNHSVEEPAQIPKAKITTPLGEVLASLAPRSTGF